MDFFSNLIAALHALLNLTVPELVQRNESTCFSENHEFLVFLGCLELHSQTHMLQRVNCEKSVEFADLADVDLLLVMSFHVVLMVQMVQVHFAWCWNPSHGRKKTTYGCTTH